MRDSIKEYVSIGGHDVVANVVEEAWNHQSYYNDLSMVKNGRRKRTEHGNLIMIGMMHGSIS